MPDTAKLFNGIQELLKALAGAPIAQSVRPWLAAAMLLAVILATAVALVVALAKIKQTVRDELLPIRFKPDGKRRANRRRRFAEHIYDCIARLNNDQQWNDYHFAELEAHVEMEGRRRNLFGLAVPWKTEPTGLRMAPSLTQAIDVSRERLILVEGDPGAGKSVALRHVATALAKHAKDKPNLKRCIPVYLNLKELRRPDVQDIDRNLIEAFVLESLNRANDRDVAQFLDEEWKRGLEEGTWLFLFDSFDEMTDVLGATEPDATIQAYTRAISDFLSGLNECRGVVASRYFRGPGEVPWPRFRILPLTDQRRASLVAKADLPPNLETEVLGRLPLAAVQLGPLASNPMFVGLLCEHVRSGRPFPENVHSVFEGYVTHRLSRDAERVAKRYRVTAEALRTVAEQVAFCMAAEEGLGISPARDEIQAVLARLAFVVPEPLNACLDALEFIKLARAEVGVRTPLFTFAHRRFQEYFATCVVLRSPDRVSAQDLVLDGRWRETATVTCQTAEASTLAPILTECRSFLEGLAVTDEPAVDSALAESSAPCEFEWPAGTLHVLNLLQEGFRGRLDELPNELRARVGHVLIRVMRGATLSHRKWALEVAGAAPDKVFLDAVRQAFGGDSQWLAEVAYRQLSRIASVPEDVGPSIRLALVSLSVRRQLWRERHTANAHLSRLKPSQPYLQSLRLLLALPFVDVAALSIGVVLLFLQFDRAGWAALVCFAVALAATLWLSTVCVRQIDDQPGERARRLAIEKQKRWLWMLPAWARLQHQFQPMTHRRAAAVVRLAASAIYLRCCCILLGPVAGLYLSHRSSSWVVLACTLWACATWGPFAYMAVATGTFTALRWWPLLPVWPLMYVLANATRTARELVAHWKPILWAVAFAVPYFTLVPRLIDSAPRLAVRYTFLATAAAGLLALLWHACSLLRRLANDHRAWRTWLGATSMLDGGAFLAHLGRFQSDVGRLKFVRSVRARSALDPHASTLLIDLIVALEDGRTAGTDFTLWRTQYEAGGRSPLASWSPNVLDELCRLRELIQFEDLHRSTSSSSPSVRPSSESSRATQMPRGSAPPMME